MNFALAIALVAAVVGFVVALLSLGFGSAPGWGQYRAFAAVAITAAFFCLVDGLSTAGLSDALTLRLSDAQGTMAALHIASWHWYAHRQLRRTPTKTQRRRLHVTTAAIGVMGAAWLVPGLLTQQRLLVLEFPRLGLVYRIPEVNLAGSIVYGVEVALLAVPLVAFVRAWRAGTRDAAVHVVAILAIVATALHDTLASTGVITSPMLLSLGFMISVGPIGWLLTRAFVQSTRALDDLSRRLEHDVETRTRELVSAEAALLRAEKMAAIGQLAASVAHEINNPAAAASANVGYLRDALAHGKLPPDAVECLDDTAEAVDRIAGIIRHLLDSGRVTTESPPRR